MMATTTPVSRHRLTVEDFHKLIKADVISEDARVELTDTTGPYDCEIKIPLYVRHRILEVWLVDVTKDRLERYRTPSLNMGAINK